MTWSREQVLEWRERHQRDRELGAAIESRCHLALHLTLPLDESRGLREVVVRRACELPHPRRRAS